VGKGGRHYEKWWFGKLLGTGAGRWEPEIRMVEEVEELDADSGRCALPAWDLRILHDREVRIDIAWGAEAIPTLHKVDGVAATQSRRTRQSSSIKCGDASYLHEPRIGVG
jgi:hypothetical protein